MNAGMNETGWCTAQRFSRVTAALVAALVGASFPLTASADKPEDAGPPPTAPGAQKNAKQHEQKAAPGQQRKAGKPQRSARSRGPARRQASAAPSGTGSASKATLASPMKARRSALAAPLAAPAIATTTATATASAASTPATSGRASRRARASAAARRRALISRRRADARRRAAARRSAARRVTAQPAATVSTAPALAPIPTATAASPAGDASRAPAPRRARAERESDAPVSVVTRTVTRTVRDIAEVIPDWAKALIVALAGLLLVATALIVGGALRNRRLRRQRAALLDEVGILQAAVLPAVGDSVGALAVSVAYRPAEGLAAGGDFYDVFPLDRQRVGIVVGDVSGHGRESLGPATFIRHMVRSYLEAGLAPRAALQLAGKVVDEHKREDFATVVAAVHDPLAGTLSYATAGHPPPIVAGPGGAPALTVASSPPIGVHSPTGLRQTTLPVGPDTTICFFTDGLTDARTPDGLFGVTRLERLVRSLPAEASADDVISAVARQSETLPDDIAVCIVRPQSGAVPASTLRVEEIEVSLPELHGARVRRFLEACGIAAADVDGVIKAAAPRVVKYGTVVLRVRLADDRSGVDVLPVDGARAGGELATLRRTSSGH